ncbi:hypothetical protein RHMOL_Rhmol10G0094700 [Rhododendron molle]|uniref:Uncharacterized protein n=1 Tax=Rhododendron molle TaxID=49168 RepID=A0ACC0M1N0_RHOML|nr:hypothetical protein RHMOL_Rhmol10G0094700 [Rhododendron molle]
MLYVYQCTHMYVFLGRNAIDRALKHGGGNDASDFCSSPSDLELQANNDDVVEVREFDESLSYSSGLCPLIASAVSHQFCLPSLLRRVGFPYCLCCQFKKTFTTMFYFMDSYEGEDSSADEVDVYSSGKLYYLKFLNSCSLTKDDDIGIKDDGQGDASVVNTLSNTVAEENCIPSDVGCILKCKSGFKCRLCPRIVCMTEETLKAHLKSKRHACSETFLNKGRLRLIRNSDGKVEGEVNAGAERCARIAAAALKKGEDANLDKASLSAKHPAKKRLKFED